MTMPQRLAALAATIVLIGAPAAWASNRDDCLQDLDQALAAIACPLYQAELAAAAAAPAADTAAAEETPAAAAPEMAITKDWLLNPASSQISLTTVKKETISETHVFTALDGRVTPSGQAEVTIDLNSLDTSIDIRNVRMRFLFFETFKFPNAMITAQLDPATFAGMAVGDTMNVAMPVKLDLHGVQTDRSVDVVVVRTTQDSVRVVSAAPVEVLVADHDLTAGLEKLQEAAGNIVITPSARVSFDLSFEGEGSNPELELARAEVSAAQTEEATRALSTEECDNRMVTISQTRAIYFTSGSAVINEAESAPVLDEVAQFFNRCQAVTMQIDGHTDSVGGEAYNQGLSERRAAAVMAALTRRNVDANRVRAAGFGESSPVADNSTNEGRAKNRRIQFSRTGG